MGVDGSDTFTTHTESESHPVTKTRPAAGKDATWRALSMYEVDDTDPSTTGLAALSATDSTVSVSSSIHATKRRSPLAS